MVIVNEDLMFKIYTDIAFKNFTGVVYDKFYKIFKKNKRTHRYYGSAANWGNGYKSWWFNGKSYGSSINNYNQKQFLKNLDKQWLF